MTELEYLEKKIDRLEKCISIIANQCNISFIDLTDDYNEKTMQQIEDKHEQAIDTLYKLKDIYCQKCPIDHNCNNCHIYECIKVLDHWYEDRPASQPFSIKSAINQLILFSLIITDENKKAEILKAIDFLKGENTHEQNGF